MLLRVTKLRKVAGHLETPPFDRVSFRTYQARCQIWTIRRNEQNKERWSGLWLPIRFDRFALPETTSLRLPESNDTPTAHSSVFVFFQHRFWLTSSAGRPQVLRYGLLNAQMPEIQTALRPHRVGLGSHTAKYSASVGAIIAAWRCASNKIGPFRSRSRRPRWPTRSSRFIRRPKTDIKQSTRWYRTWDRAISVHSFPFCVTAFFPPEWRTMPIQQQYGWTFCGISDSSLIPIRDKYSLGWPPLAFVR